MKKFGLMIAAIMTITVIIFSGCGQIDKRADRKDSSFIQKEITMEQKVKEDSSSQIDDSSELEDSSSEQKENSSKNESCEEEVNKEETSEGFRKDSNSSRNSDSSSSNSLRNSRIVITEEVKPELGPPPIEDIEPTMNEDTERMVGSIGPQLKDKIVFKPSTHYLHRATCHWVSNECYEITDTSDIEARICTECNPNIEVINEYKEPEPIVSSPTYWNGPVLNPSAGVVYGPSGKETYYNLDMTGVISIMRGMGFDSVNYPYWVRSDGCKMLGNYIMVAAALDVHPRGTLVECSLGTAIVCDTGGFAYSNPYQLDVAVTW